MFKCILFILLTLVVGDISGQAITNTKLAALLDSIYDEDQTGRINEKPYEVPGAKKNSIESWIAKTNYPYSFTDFKSVSDRNEQFWMKADNYHKYAKADWANFFDGFFYIKDMYGCDLLKSN